MKDIETSGNAPMRPKERLFWFLVTPALLWLDWFGQLFGIEFDVKVLYRSRP